MQTLSVLLNGSSLFRDKIPALLVPRQHLRKLGSSSEFGRRAHEVRQKLDASVICGGVKSSDHTSIDTILAHCGLHKSEEIVDAGCASNAPLAPPLEMSTTYERPSDGIYPPHGKIYSRTCNPTRKLLEMEVATLETFGTRNVSIHRDKLCTAFASGMAAVSALLLAYPSAHVLLPDDCYHGVPTLLAVLNQHGVSHSTVDMTHIEKLVYAIEEWKGIKTKPRTDFLTNEKTLIVWLETPSNPLTKITDIQAVCNVIQRFNLQHSDSRIITFVDSTWSPPNITQPLLVGFFN